MVNKTSFLLICLLAISSAVGQTEPDSNEKNRRFLGISFPSSKPASAPEAPATPAVAVLPTLPPNPPVNYSALPAYFTEDAKYQSNNDLLQILNLFTTRKTVEAIVNEFWHNAPTVETCVSCNVLIRHMIYEYKGNEAGFKKFFYSVCELLKLDGEANQEFCTGLTEIYAPQLFYILENTKLNSEEICASLLTECLDHYHWYGPPLFWEVKISEKIDYVTNATSKIKEYMAPRDATDESTQNAKKSPPPTETKPYVASPPATYNENNYPVGKPYYEGTFEGARFLHLTDLHLDLLYSLHSDGYCDRILCCRRPEPPVSYPPAAEASYPPATEASYPPVAEPATTASPVYPPGNKPVPRMADPNPSYLANLYSANQTYAYSNALKKPAGYWGSFGKCDSPLRLIKHMLRHLSKFVDQIDYVVFSGDSISHNIWSTNKEQVIRTNEILIKLITKYLLTPSAAKPGAYGNPSAYQPRRLVPVIGNHESDVVSMFPSSSLQYSKFSIDWLYKALYEQWKPHIPLDQVPNFLKGGYYSVVIAKNMKLIVLNTNACYRLNFWTLLNNQDPDGQLAWLEQELYAAEKLKQNVHLIGHIAPEKKSCNAIWLHNFIQLVTRYQATIKAQFYGHSHLDEVKIYYGSSVKRIIGAREAVESVHQERHSEQSAESLVKQVTARSSDNEPEQANQTKRIVNTVAKQQIQQLINLENLQSQLQHLNQDILYKTKISLTDKINGYHANPYPGYTKETKTPISIAFLSPSVSPYDDLNPAYRVFIVEDTGYVANAKTFYADIEEANRNHDMNLYKPQPGYPQPQPGYPKTRAISNEAASEEPDELETGYDEDVEMESENQVSYSYAMPERSAPSYPNSYGSSSYPSAKSIAGYSYASAPGYGQSAADHSSYPPQSNPPVTYQPNGSKTKAPKKSKDYVESNGESHYQNNQNYAAHYAPAAKSLDSGYGQPPKSTYSKPTAESQLPYHPVYEKYTVQPKPLKKYSTNQNSYQASSYPAKPSSYQPNPPKPASPYPPSKAVYDNQPKQDYATAKPAYQQPASPAKSNSYPSSYPKDAPPKPSNVPSQTLPPPPSYQNSYEQYIMSTVDSYRPKYNLPADLEYEYKNYEEPNQYDAGNAKSSPVPSNPVYSPSVYHPSSPPVYPPSSPQQNAYPPSKQEYSAPKVQASNYPKPQNYSKPATYPQPATGSYQPNTSNYSANPAKPSPPKSSSYQATPPKNYTTPFKPVAHPPAAQMQNYPPFQPQSTYAVQPSKENKPVNNYKPVEYAPKATYQPPKESKPASSYPVHPPSSYQPPKENKPASSYPVHPPSSYQPPKESKPASSYPMQPPSSYQPPKESKPANNYKPAEYQSNSHYQQPKESKPASSYPVPPANNYKPQTTYAYTERPASYEPNTYYSKPKEPVRYNPPVSYAKPAQPYKANSTSTYQPANAYPSPAKYTTDTKPASKYPPSQPPVNPYPSMQPPYPLNHGKPANSTKPVYPPKPVYSQAAKNYSTPAPPLYQPIGQAPKIEYNFTNSYAHPPSPPAARPLPSSYVPPKSQYAPKNGYQPAPYKPYQPAPYQPYVAPEHAPVYEYELGNRLYNPARVPSPNDYRLMKMRKEDKELKWRFEYDLNSEYSIARSTPYDWVNFIGLLRTDNALFERFYRNLYRYSSAERWKYPCNEQCRQHLLDEIYVIDPLDY